MFKGVFTRLLLTTFFLTVVQAAWGQTADEIIEKHLAAVGGRANLEKLKSRSMKGTVNLTTPIGDLSGNIEVLDELPNKNRTFVELDLSALGLGKVIQDQRFNGASGYVVDSMQGDRDITGEQLESLKNGAFPSPFLNYKQSGLTVELAGKEKAGAQDAYVLIVKPKNGPPTRLFIDAQSYLPIKRVVTINAPQVGELEQATETSDFRDVDGIKVPFKVRTISSVQTVNVTVSKVEHNITIDPALFSKPAAK